MSACVWKTAACKNRTFTCSGDNYQWIYVDGQLVSYSDNWKITSTVSIPHTATILAAQITDADNTGGFLGSLSDGNVTDNSWKCTTIFFNGWNTPQFDDRTWPYATTTKKNGDPPWGTLPSILSNAEWIWAGPYDAGIQWTVYCRKILGSFFLECGIYWSILVCKYCSHDFERDKLIIISFLLINSL